MYRVKTASFLETRIFFADVPPPPASDSVVDRPGNNNGRVLKEVIYPASVRHNVGGVGDAPANSVKGAGDSDGGPIRNSPRLDSLSSAVSGINWHPAVPYRLCPVLDYIGVGRKTRVGPPFGFTISDHKADVEVLAS